MSPAVEKMEFQAEAKQLLDLMIHSVYSHKEIFLRELISNSSDALDKLRFESLTQPDLARMTANPHIFIEADSEKHTLAVVDNGIGMSRDEVIRFIGSIAKSGAEEFKEFIKKKKKGDELSPDLIGQFGVGFYSSFMVADRVTLVTRRAGEETATKWESDGDGTYSLEEAAREEPGTTVTLHLKDADEEEGIHDFTQEWKIREIVGKYSDYVSYPIKMNVERTEVEKDKDGKPVEGGKETKVVEETTLNSMKAIWTRDPGDVSEEEYKEFYKHVSHDWTDPLLWTTLKAEGILEFRSLLYIPSKAPIDMFMREHVAGLHLYVRRVFIMNDCKELIPEYLRFVRGVVDSEDLSLNISREILQQNRQIQMMRKNLVKKVLSTLKDLQKEDESKYTTFWGEFGRVLKEGLYQDHDNRDELFEIVRFESTHVPEGEANVPEGEANASEGTTTLAEYVGRMKEGQNEIYFVTGESRSDIEHSPHIEAFKEKGYEVLLMTDPVDELWTQWAPQYQEKSFQSIAKGQVELGDEEEKKKAEEVREKKEKEYKSLLECVQSKLDANVKEVRLSNRLTSSPACLVGDTMDQSAHLEQLMKAAGQDVPTSKRILEINPDHAILKRMQAAYDANKEDALLGDYSELLYGQAVIAEGGRPPDAARFCQLLSDLMAPDE